MHLEIIHEDEHLIAINKPHGLLVHKTPLAKDATEFALQILRDQIGYRVYPAHRLDRKTSGVLLFTKDNKTNSEIQKLFRDRQVHKCYLAIVRGYLIESGQIDYALEHNDSIKEAQTEYSPIERYEINVPLNGLPTSRYSLVELIPATGRFHQLRKHMAHIFHPIIGDRPHGCNKQNKLWKEKLGISQMLLHASTISFPWQGQEIEIRAQLSPEFNSAMKLLQERS